MRIDIWSDVVCPFCYIGKRRLEQALAEFPHADEVTVRWHSFELDAHAPAVHEVPTAELLARKYGMSTAQVQASQASLTEQAAGVGLAYHLDRTRSGNSFNAHRLIHLADRDGLQDAMKERLLLAYFTEGVAIGDDEALVGLAVEVGLAENDVRAMLAADDFADAVRGDEAQAQRIGISGVPFFVLDGRLAISGAQPAEVFTAGLAQAWETRAVASV